MHRLCTERIVLLKYVQLGQI